MTNLNQTTEPAIKQICFEAILKGTNVVNDAALLQELKPLYDLQRLQRTYPVEVYQEFVERIRASLYPGLAHEEANFKLGQKAFDGYLKGTIVGRVALAAIYIMGPSRLMAMSERLWGDVGLGECKPEKLGEGYYRVRYRNFLLEPAIVLGVAVEALVVAKAQKLIYSLEPLPDSGPYFYNFDVVFQWEG